MGLRAWVVRYLGEGVARKIETFVDGTVFGDPLVTCPACRRRFSAVLLSERGHCPVCRAPLTNDVTVQALEARKQAAIEAGQAAARAVREIERELDERRGGAGDHGAG